MKRIRIIAYFFCVFAGIQFVLSTVPAVSGAGRAGDDTVEITAPRIEAEVRAHFRKKLEGAGYPFTIKKIFGARDIKVPRAFPDMRVQSEPGIELKRRFPADIIFSKGSEFERRIRVIADVEILGMVVSTTKPLARFQPIGKDDVALVRQDITRIRANAFFRVEDVIGKRARRKISAKTVLRKDLVERRPLVERGDVVTVVLEARGFKITTAGEIRQKGARGDMVRVENLDSQKDVVARVVDKNTVRIDF